MSARWSARLRSFTVLAAVVVFGTSCDAGQKGPAETPFSPPSADLLSLDPLFQADNYTFTLITERLDFPLSGFKVSKVIGLGGGSITLLGHTLTVPAGAVTVPTLFLMVALPTPVVDVELTATVTDLLGRVLNVGSKGFRKPVTLTLTYDRATNVTDPSKLFIVYLNGSESESLPSTVNQANKTVTAQLQHFSAYAMAE